MKTYFKNVFKTINNNRLKFIALFSIISLGVCFVTGVGGISPKIRNTFNEEIKNKNCPDLILKSKKTTGFSEEEIETLKTFYDIQNFSVNFNVDQNIDNKQTRLMVYDMKSKVNELTLLKGTFPVDPFDCVVEEEKVSLEQFELGSTIEYQLNEMITIKMKVVGIVKNPLIFSINGEPTIEEGKNNKNLDRIFYLDSNKNNLLTILPKTDIYLTLKSTNKLNIFSNKYFDSIESSKKIIQTYNGFSSEDVAILSLKDNKSYVVLSNITDKVDVIANIFPSFFIVVVGLVVLTTMSRLITEDRSSIGCFSSLGYTNSQIRFKYVFFSLFSTLAGSALGLSIGAYLFPNLIYPAFGSMFILPDKITSEININMGLISSVIMFVAVISVTLFELSKELRDTPSMLLLPKAPKPGKKILLEHINFIWSKLKFKYKSTFRNIFRYVGRLLMVVISVAGSSALVMAGFGLYDVSRNDLTIFGITMNISATLSPISIIIIAFALLLSVLVLFNLTNMNIQERKREIATLQVLGYYNIEIYGYIFREIIIMSLIGIFIGIPLGIGLLAFIFNYLNFGGLENVLWYSYLLVFACCLLFVLLVSLLLIPKINSVDMNESLKSIE